MKTVKDALAVYEELNISDRLTFYITLTSQLNADKDDNLLMETRFPNGLYADVNAAYQILRKAGYGATIPKKVEEIRIMKVS